LFYEQRFQQFGRDYPHLEGFDFVEEVLRYFDFSLRLRDSERKRIPASGRVVIAANHPIGSLDGLALLSLVRQVRPDVKVVANQLLTAIGPLHPVLLPVNNMDGNTARSNLKSIRAHLEQDGALIIFPAGEVSRFGPRGVRDGACASTHNPATTARPTSAGCGMRWPNATSQSRPSTSTTHRPPTPRASTFPPSTWTPPSATASTAS